MAKPRTKKRTNAPAAATNNASTKPSARNPKSMVIRIGASQIGPSLTQLVHDVRTMMAPETASKLRERRNNKLRDYTTMAGPLGVTHLMLFSRPKAGNVNLRLAVTPRGPTLSFRVERYSLCKDVGRSLKRPRGASGGGGEFLSPPLLVMNNFSSQADGIDGEKNSVGEGKKVPKHLETLATTVFQSLFPPINPTATPLKNIKRVLLIDRETPSDPARGTDADDSNYTLTLRHYAIETRTARSVPKPLRRLDAAEKLAHAGQKRKRSGLPNLGKLEDVADYLLDPHGADGFTSGSESEPETDAEVEVLAPASQKVEYRPRKARRAEGEDSARPIRDRRDLDAASRVEKKGIKLHELGPRLRLRLVKVEEGLCTGRVMWHALYDKSAEEIKEMERVHEKRRVERERRREEQRANVERKRAEKEPRGASEPGENGDEKEDEDDEDELWSDEEAYEDYLDDDALDADGADREEAPREGGEDDGIEDT